MPDDIPPEEEEEEWTEEDEARYLSRRRFLKLGLLAGGVIGAGAIAGGVLTGLIKFGGDDLKPWETSRGVVDYSRVPQTIPNELRVAQWYDYWPGIFITNFKDYIRTKYGKSIEVKVDIFTNNEELFTWITQSGRAYDVMFPSNYTAEIMDRGGHLANMNEEWLPNLGNLADGVRTGYGGNVLADFLTPQGTPFAFRSNGSRIAVPYQWGTTGLGYNTDVFTRADIESLGLDVFRRSSWGTTTLTGRMAMLDDLREVLGAGMKMAGWDAQIAEGLTPTGIPGNPLSPYNGRYQWTQNETDAGRIATVRDLIKNGVVPRLLGFNTQNQGPYLRDGTTYANQAWSGDVIYSIQPYSNTAYPVDYFVPKHGGAVWVDAAVVHRQSEGLFLAHEFINFFLEAIQGKIITDWNLYATPNLESYSQLASYPNGYDPRLDQRIYPPPEDFDLLDYQKDVGVAVTRDLYTPAWNTIKFG